MSKTTKVLEKCLGEKFHIGMLLRAYRTREDLTQTELATKLGTTKSEVSDIETGKKSISPERAVTFAKILNEPIEVFLATVFQDQIDKLGLRYTVKVAS